MPPQRRGSKAHMGSSTQGSSKSGKGKGSGYQWADEVSLDDFGQGRSRSASPGTLVQGHSVTPGTTEVAEAAFEDGYQDPLDDDIFGDEAGGGGGQATDAAVNAEAPHRVLA